MSTLSERTTSTEDRWSLSVPFVPPLHAQERTRTSMQRFLRSLAMGTTLGRAAELTGITPGTVSNWRKKYPEFDEQVQKMLVRTATKKAGAKQAVGTSIFDPNRPVPDKGTFAEFRMKYFGRPTLPHQVDLVDALEDKTNNVIICLMPPGAGKDTLVGDYLLYELSDNREGMRTSWIMESENFAKRRLQRLLRYLTDKTVYGDAPQNTPGGETPASNLVDDYGPFRWEKGMVYKDGGRVERPEWTKLQAYFVQSVAPEADPNLWATGIGGATYGSRMELAVVSDAFTTENQRSPTMRLDQMVWLEGTLDTRLDEKGRLVVIGTELPIENNYELLEDRYTKGARVVEQRGWYTKYSNGTAVVKVPAIWYDDEGEEVSYWPERFPLDGQIFDERRDEPWNVAELTEEEEDELLSRSRVRRVRGLRERRTRNPEQFEAMYNQRRPTEKGGDFTDEVLNAADERDRTLKQTSPGDIIVIGVDPARVYGAAWVAWAVNRKAGTITLIDYFYGTKLGIEGIKQQLILTPLTTYKPLWLAYEINAHSAILEDWTIKQAIDQYATNVYRHQTSIHNRASGSIGPASLAPYMRTGVIRFPTRTMEDQRRIDIVKGQFKAWDKSTLTGGGTRTRPGRASHQPDDIAMAAWTGFVKARDLLEMNDRSLMPRMPVPRAVQRQWEKFQEEHTTRRAVRKVDRQQVSVSNIVSMVIGGSDDYSE